MTPPTNVDQNYMFFFKMIHPQTLTWHLTIDPRKGESHWKLSFLGSGLGFGGFFFYFFGANDVVDDDILFLHQLDPDNGASRQKRFLLDVLFLPFLLVSFGDVEIPSKTHLTS